MICAALLLALLSVGPGKTYAKPSQAAAAAQDGDTVEIAAGTYPGDVAVWRASRLTLRGKGGRAVLDAQGKSAERKAIWVIQGDDTRVENIEFMGESVPDRNGAGIRQEGQGLIVSNCLFHDNENGILAGASPKSDIVVENSEFRHNGQGDGYSHNLYIGHIRSFTLRGCWSHDAHAGHDVKSRADVNSIIANRINDDAGSDTSYLLDFPNGGECRVIGNLFERGASAANGTLINFAEEGAVNPKQALALVSNTLINTRLNAVYLRITSAPTLRVVNNLFEGPGQHIVGASKLEDSQGNSPGKLGDYDLTPHLQYVSPTGTRARPPQVPLQLGAFAFAAQTDRKKL